MPDKLQELAWKFYLYKSKKLLLWGLKNHCVSTYTNALIEKLRGIYYGGVPASILLLAHGKSNGNCYDSATLLSRAFLDEDGDVKLIYASVDALRLNPRNIHDNPMYADHCFVERTSKNGKKYIFDTSMGLVYDKRLYWLIENPRVRKVNNKEDIIKYVKETSECEPEDIERDKYAMPLILPMLELLCDRDNEFYASPGVELLQREIRLFKEKIDYDAVCEEIKEDMKRMKKISY